MDFIVDKTERDGVLVVAPKGEIDVYSAPPFKTEMVAAMDAGARRLVVDLSGVGFMDSSGLGVLVSVLKRTKDAGGSLRLVCEDERILKIFRITGLTKVFDIDPSVEVALEAIGAV